MTAGAFPRLPSRSRRRWSDESESYHRSYLARLWDGEVVEQSPGQPPVARGGIKHLGDARGLSVDLMHRWMDAASSGTPPPRLPPRGLDLLLQLAHEGGIDLSPRRVYASRYHRRFELLLVGVGVALATLAMVSLLVPLPDPYAVLTFPVLVAFAIVGILAELVVIVDQRAAHLLRGGA